MDIVARQIGVSGRVQGVAFRMSTKITADELTIKGFVRNERDGSVYIEAEGDPIAMDAFVAWCRTGPRMARVDQFEVTEINPVGFTDFTIQR